MKKAFKVIGIVVGAVTCVAAAAVGYVIYTGHKCGITWFDFEQMMNE